MCSVAGVVVAGGWGGFVAVVAGGAHRAAAFPATSPNEAVGWMGPQHVLVRTAQEALFSIENGKNLRTGPAQPAPDPPPHQIK